MARDIGISRNGVDGKSIQKEELACTFVIEDFLAAVVVAQD